MMSATKILVTNYFWGCEGKHDLIAPGKTPKTVGVFKRWQKRNKNAPFQQS